MKFLSTKTLIIGLIAVGLVFLLGGGVFSPDTPTDSSDESPQSSTTEKPSESSDAGTPSTTEEPAPTQSDVPEPEFGIDVVRNSVEECGFTCRDVSATATISNTGEADAEDVQVELLLFVPAGDTNRTIWEGSESVGLLPAGDSHSTTRDIRISGTDSLSVYENDCTYHYQFVIETTDGTNTYWGQQENVC